MATITRTKSGTWKAMIRRQGWPTTIKTFRLKRDAQDWARETESAMVRGVYIPRAHGERLTLDRALDRYRLEVTPTKKASTASRETDLAVPLRTALGKYSLAAITPDIVAEYRDRRLAAVSKKTGRPMSASSVRLELALLGHLYAVAIKEWGLGLTLNPVQMIRRPSPGEGRNRRLTGDEEARLLAAVDAHSNPMLGWIVRLALYTGMRQGEILSLTADQVDLDRRVVRLTETKNGSARTVPLSRAAVDVLREALASPLRRGTSLVFPGDPRKDGTRRPYTINRVWRFALARAGIVGLRFHDLRHEAVSRLVERGLSDQEVAAISGHKSMQMLRRYTHLRAEDLVDKLG
ncbi:integrase [Acidihalobacter aeolianus]|uniref:Integrase n=1 Tax=Acidihalobacter aeolianus TaxID=2792603 RepID=A0A1D8KA81_9GAMM|nr:site-specific integrase [Acidihalobacter aeolianus]AOV17847.1 integrase [Acidihalobacter aeolianus]